MYILKNAYRNVVRSKMRSLMLCVCVFAIALSSCIALSIKNSSDNARVALLDGMEVTATLEIDRTSLMSQNRGEESDRTAMMETMMKTMSLDEMLIYAEASSVDSFRYYESVSMSGEDIEAYSTTTSMMPGMSGQGSSGDFTVIAYPDENSATLFNDYTLVIEDGEYFNDSDYLVLISDELSYTNDLSVGDTIVLTNPSQDSETFEVTINGIFSCASSDSYVNDIYTNSATVEAILEQSVEMETTYTDGRMGIEISSVLTSRQSGTYVFKSVDDLTTFEIEVEALGLDMDTYSVVSTDVESFEETLLPIEQVAEFTMIFLVVILVIGVIILFILTTFSIRERKYEIGVLAAIGMKKTQVAFQFASEMLLITSLSVAIALGVGAIASQPIANVLLSDQIESMESSSTFQPGMTGGMQGGMQSGMQGGISTGMTSEVEYIDTLDTSVDSTMLLQLFALTLALSALASSVSIVSILRYEPLKILSERS